MKILIFGASGMIGHKMYQVLSQTYPDTFACIHGPAEKYEKFNLFKKNKLLDNVDVLPFENIEKILSDLQPQVILNCVGITLRKEKIKDQEYCQRVNTQFPHFLKNWVDTHPARLIHFSTDCVFDGSKDLYTENDPGSAQDIYGQTKYQGEVSSPHSLTLRGSMIGRELYDKTELLEWALRQKGKSIKGFSNVIYSGVTTLVMADLVLRILQLHPRLFGLYQVASAPISKYQLLVKINREFDLNMDIQQDFSYVSKKELSGQLLQKAIGFICPSWDDMLSQLARDKTNYI